MAHKVTLSGDVEINGESYPKGVTLSVSDSIFKRLTDEGKVAPEKKDGGK